MTGPGQNDFQIRLRGELAELRDRLNTLDVFVRSAAMDGLPEEEQQRLVRQRVHMAAYASVLSERAKVLGVAP